MDPVYLAVSYHSANIGGQADCPLWVFVYTDPPNANLQLSFDPPLSPPPAATIVPYTQIDKYNTIYRIEGIPDKQTFRMHIKAIDPTGVGRPDAHFTGLLSRRRSTRPGYGPGITITYPGAPIGGKPTVVPRTFMAYGYVDPTTAVMSSWAVDSSNNVSSGVAVTPPPNPYDWAFAYQLTNSGLYTLNVQGVSDGTSIATVPFKIS